MALALLFALALAVSDPPTAAAPPLSRANGGRAIPDGAPQDDYRFVAWCHERSIAGQIQLDPIVEKDMDAIEGKAKAAQRRAGDEMIAKEHKRYMALYEKALLAAEKASPTAIHQQGVEAELQGYKIWGATQNKAPIWRMVDWGNWEPPPRCEKAAKRLYDRATLFGEALKTETPPAPEKNPRPETNPNQDDKSSSDTHKGPS